MKTTTYDACAASSHSHGNGHDHASSNNHNNHHLDTPHDAHHDAHHHEESSLHNHSHDHGNNEPHHSNADGQQHVMRKLKTATALCVTFFLVEVTGGYLAGSLAVLSDAAHLLADLASFAVAIAASHLGSLPTTDQHTFGLKRVESLAALFSMISLALVSVGLFVEAIRRLVLPPEQNVDGQLMSGIAAIGVVVNIILAFVLGEHHVHMPGASHGHDHSHDHEKEVTLLEQCVDFNSVPQHSDELPPPTNHQNNKNKVRNINLHAAYLHVLGDLAQSVAVLIAGLVIWWKPSWQVVDPICTLLFCALVFYSTLGVLRSSISVLLEEVPPHVSWRRVHDDIQAVEGVTGVHDLHIWSISHSIPTLSVHCFSQHPEEALEQIYQVCQTRGIVHATIQIQQGTCKDDCITCTAHHEKACHSVETSNRNSYSHHSN